MDIITDIHEEKSAAARHLQQQPGVRLDVQTLACGDYVLAAGVAVARKSATDFVLSVMEKALFSQVAKLRTEYARVIFLIEGDLFETRFHLSPAALRNALAYLVAVEGVSVLPSPSPESSAELILTMAQQVRQNPQATEGLRGAKPKTVTRAQQFLVEGLPGVGPEQAEALLARFGSVAAILAAADEELAQVPGLSARAVFKIREVLDSPWKGLALTRPGQDAN